MTTLREAAEALIIGHNIMRDTAPIPEVLWNNLRAALAQPKQEPDMPRLALERAEEWIRGAPHGDNCFVSDHYDGDPGNRCNCGKESLEEYLSEVLEAQPQQEPTPAYYVRHPDDSYTLAYPQPKAQPPEPHGWKPIETAPEEGEWALVFADGAMNCAWVRAGRFPEDLVQAHSWNIQPHDVSHWMPLPTPPEGK